MGLFIVTEELMKEEEVKKIVTVVDKCPVFFKRNVNLFRLIVYLKMRTEKHLYEINVSSYLHVSA